MSPNINDIAIFPLEMFLLPGETSVLHIFEERYLQLIQDCEEGYLPGFGVLFKNKENTNNYGSFVELVEVIERLPGGQLNIRIKAISLFALQEYAHTREGRLYPGGKIYRKPLFDHLANQRVMNLWRMYMLRSGQEDHQLLDPPQQTVMKIASTLEMGELDKLELIDLGTHHEREIYLYNYIRFLDSLYDQEEYTFHGIYLN